VDAFSGELVAVVGTVALKQAVAFEFTQIVTEFVESIGFVRGAESGEEGLVDLLGRPTSGLSSGVEQDLQEPNDPTLMDFDSGVVHGADGDGPGEALKQGEIDMNVEPLCLEGSEAVGDLKELFFDGRQLIQPFLQCEVGQVIGAQLVSERWQTFRSV
jgi:hypothetical protein